ncbi:glycosyltransferase family 4 protein [candidate division KSB1 bacterium]|nr:glycosyltransferase family 4 protein [candidate division KSB1 bacterium]
MADPLKKVLIIAYYWPPAGGPGAIRIVKWVKYLVRLGWQPIVLTVKDGEFPYHDPGLVQEILEDVPVHRTNAPSPFTLYKKITEKKSGDSLPVGVLSLEKRGFFDKLSSWIRCNLFVPDARIGWIRQATKRACELIREHDIKVMLISSPPHSSQLIGLRVKKKMNVRWLADLRDPWTEIRHYESVSRSPATVWLDKHYEKQVLETCDHMTTVSKTLAADFERLGGSSNRISVLMNGFDPDDFPISEHPKTDQFRIVHTGNLLENQNPEVLWQALQRLLDSDPKLKTVLKIRLTGRTHPAVIKSNNQYGLEPYLLQQPFIPHDSILHEIQNASLLFVTVPNVTKNRGIVTGKLLEYTGSRCPILVIGPMDGDAADIARSLSNSRAVQYNNVDACQEFVQSIYQSWLDDRLPEPEPAQIEAYSRLKAVKDLTELLAS